MSKSKGNVINPDDIVAEFGADTLRLYEMFVGDFEKSAPWSPQSIRGCRRFVERVFSLTDIVSGEGITPELEQDFHRTVKKVTSDIDGMKFNTAIAQLMTLLNKIFEVGRLTKNELETYISLLCPFAPHICEEMWEQLGHSNLLSLSAWPSYDDSLTISETVEYVLQINGKLKSKIKLPAGTDEASAIEAALKDEKIADFTEGKQIVKKIFVPGKIINFVVR